MTMSPTMSSLSSRLLFIASVIVAVPVIGALFAVALIGAVLMRLSAALQSARRPTHTSGPLVIDGEYTVVEARTVPIRSSHRH